jgi:hypothetical protein
MVLVLVLTTTRMEFHSGINVRYDVIQLLSYLFNLLLNRYLFTSDNFMHFDLTQVTWHVGILYAVLGAGAALRRRGAKPVTLAGEVSCAGG